jgi:hypothetical protein
VTYSYDELGRLRSATYSNGSITYVYDAAGNRTTLTQTGASPPTVSLTANPASISAGNASTLSWTTTNATTTSIDNGVGAVSPVAGGSVSVSPAATTTYTLTATGPGGQASAQATVTVNASNTFSATVQITGAGPVNLRTLANAAGYNGAQNATVTFQLGASVTIMGAPGNSSTAGGRAIDTGVWPSGSYAIALSLQVSGKAYGGGGGGGNGAGGANGSLGAAGGDAIYAQENLTVTINVGGEVKAGGGGGGGGGGRLKPTLEIDRVGGGGGGGFPNGVGGAMGDPVLDFDAGSAANGANGTTTGGGAGGAGEATGGGAGGAGAGAGAVGATGAAGSGTGTVKAPGAGGAAGYAVRKNGKTVAVTNNGTLIGTVA